MRRFLLSPRGLASLALCALSLTPAYAADAPLPTAFFSEAGVRVLHLQTSGPAILDIALEVKAGSRYDPPNKAGVADLTSGLIGVALAPGLGQPAVEEAAHGREASRLALQRSVSAGSDWASMRIRALADEADRAAVIDWVGQSLARPSFAQALVERERAASVQSLADQLAQPQTRATRALWASMYPGHPYGLRPTPESLSSITPADLEAFYQANWRPERMRMAIVGPVTQAEARRIADALLRPLVQSHAQWPAVAQQAATARVPSAAASRAALLARLGPATPQVLPMDTAQAHIWLGMPVVQRSERDDSMVLQVANHILGGGGFAALLTEEIREKRGLAYSVFSAVRPQVDAGPFFIGMQTQQAKAEESLEVIRATLKDFIEKGPTPQQLDAARKNLLGGYALQIDSNSKLLNQLAAMAAYDLPLDTLQTYTQRVQAVTAEDIRRVLRERIDLNRLQTVLVGGVGQ